MPEAPDLRISDQERENLAEEIREHYAAGRLNADELDPRLQAAYAARTAAELQAVRADLPALPPSPARQRAELSERRHRLQRQLIQQTGGALMVFVICTVIWLASGAHGSFWPAWVAIVPVITLLQNGWRLYGPAPELDVVERELGRGDRDRRRQRRSQVRGRRSG